MRTNFVLSPPMGNIIQSLTSCSLRVVLWSRYSTQKKTYVFDRNAKKLQRDRSVVRSDHGVYDYLKDEVLCVIRRTSSHVFRVPSLAQGFYIWLHHLASQPSLVFFREVILFWVLFWVWDIYMQFYHIVWCGQCLEFGTSLHSIKVGAAQGNLSDLFLSPKRSPLVTNF